MNDNEGTKRPAPAKGEGPLWKALLRKYGGDERVMLKAVLDAEAACAYGSPEAAREELRRHFAGEDEKLLPAVRPVCMASRDEAVAVLCGPVEKRPADTLARLGFSPDGTPLAE